MLCPLCTRKKARRACPALGREICPTCCGTKRLVEIRCPPDCAYLAAAREHPAAAVARQQQRDLEWVAARVRDLSDRQSKLFFLVGSVLARYAPDDLHVPIDDDVAEALGALAATLETSSRGVIYEHRPASGPAERLAAALKPLLTEVGKGGGTAFERDAAVVLRQIERAARDLSADGNRRAFLDLLERVIARPAVGEAAPPDVVPPEGDGPRLILP